MTDKVTILSPAAQPEVEAAHLPKIDGVAVAVQDREPRVRRALDEHARDPVAARRACVEHLRFEECCTIGHFTTVKL